MNADQASGNIKQKGPQVSAHIQVWQLKIFLLIKSSNFSSLKIFFKQADDPKVQKKAAKKLEKQQVPQRTEGQKKVALFSHLHQYERSLSITSNMGWVISIGFKFFKAKLWKRLFHARTLVCF